MIRKAAAILALSTLATFAAGCSGAPGGGFEPSESSSAALSIPSCAKLPFTILDESDPGDQGDGFTKRGKVTYACDALTILPVAPASYPPGVITSCSQATIVTPEANLSECTSGYSLLNDTGGFDEVFLCPTSMPLPPKTTTPDGVQVNSYAPLPTPADGCLGTPYSPSEWQYVVHDMSINDIGGQCGGPCMSF